jgi:hypothetical protein
LFMALLGAVVFCTFNVPTIRSRMLLSCASRRVAVDADPVSY